MLLILLEPLYLCSTLHAQHRRSSARLRDRFFMASLTLRRTCTLGHPPPSLSLSNSHENYISVAIGANVIAWRIVYETFRAKLKLRAFSLRLRSKCGRNVKRKLAFTSTVENPVFPSTI